MVYRSISVKLILMVAIKLLIVMLILIILMLLWVIYNLIPRNDLILIIIVIFMYLYLYSLYKHICSTFKKNIPEDLIPALKQIAIIFLIVFILLTVEQYFGL